VYHETNQPPKQPGICDDCGSQLKQREDDKPEVVRTRLEVNLKNLEPLLDYYRRQSKLVQADGQRPVDEITRDILRLLQEE
jgi:adenylate kinase